MAGDSQLLTKQINIAVSHRMAQKLEAIERKEGVKPPQFGRIAIAEKLERKTGEVNRLAAELRRLGGDPEQTLRAGIAALEQQTLAAR